jgi:hypothetical protein
MGNKGLHGDYFKWHGREIRPPFHAVPLNATDCKISASHQRRVGVSSDAFTLNLALRKLRVVRLGRSEYSRAFPSLRPARNCIGVQGLDLLSNRSQVATGRIQKKDMKLGPL